MLFLVTSLQHMAKFICCSMLALLLNARAHAFTARLIPHDTPGFVAWPPVSIRWIFRSGHGLNVELTAVCSAVHCAAALLAHQDHAHVERYEKLRNAQVCGRQSPSKGPHSLGVCVVRLSLGAEGRRGQEGAGGGGGDL